MQAPGMYGDGWTPLMACCVAGHLGIARFLLRRAGPDVRRLVLSANRYGLTAGHIAARRGDVDLLHLLLQAAGGDVSKVGPHCMLLASLRGLLARQSRPPMSMTSAGKFL